MAMGLAQLMRNVAFQAGNLGGSLSQWATNGNSKLGTLQADKLPSFLTNNPMPNGYPWSTLGPETNYYETHPNTGVIRRYDFTVSRGKISPDGYKRDVLLVNGGFPGPLIEANWGDTIQVTLHNNLTDEGTALHWHGFLQTGRPWEDGVPAVSQCPVPPQKSFTYQFKAELYGTSWYHSHYSAQYSGGLAGPIVIHGPRRHKYEVDLGPILLSDWYHDDYFNLVQQTMAPGALPILSDSNLINGKMNFDCSLKASGDETPCVSDAGISQFLLKPGKTHLLRLVNIGSEGTQRFSIDGHKLTVVSNDFVDIEPYETEVVTLGIGQRSNVLVTADGEPGAYWMRSNVSTTCSRAKQPAALAAVYYKGVNTKSLPRSTAWSISETETCMDDDLELTRPVLKMAAKMPSITYHMDLGAYVNQSNIHLWTLGSTNTSYRGNYNSPTLLLSNLGNYSFEEQWNVIDTEDNETVRIVLNNTSGVSHPMHLHGFNMQVLSVGPGSWDGTIVNAANPQRRDVVLVPGHGHLVVQFEAGANPGVWPFHCHISWHASAGLFAQFLTKPREVEQFRIPNVVAETCRQWGKWTKTNIPDQIDSGL